MARSRTGCPPREERMEVKQMLLGLFTRVQTWWFATRERFEDESGAVATEYALLLLRRELMRRQ